MLPHGHAGLQQVKVWPHGMLAEAENVYHIFIQLSWPNITSDEDHWWGWLVMQHLVSRMSLLPQNTSNSPSQRNKICTATSITFNKQPATCHHRISQMKTWKITVCWFSGWGTRRGLKWIATHAWWTVLQWVQSSAETTYLHCCMYFKWTLTMLLTN